MFFMNEIYRIHFSWFVLEFKLTFLTNVPMRLF